MEVLALGGGTVEAVFQHTLYLNGGEGLLCVGGRDLARGPLNLCLHDVSPTSFLASTVSAGSPWRFQDGELDVAGIAVLRLFPVEPWQSKPATPACPDEIACCLETLRRHAPQPASGGTLSHKTGELVAGELRSGMRALSRWLVRAPALEHEGASLSPAALALLGCGPGLTPSGDDILVGALVTLANLGAQDSAHALGNAISGHLKARTSTISAAHLSAAIEGEAVEPVHRVVRALAEADPSRCADATTRLCDYGQSSGADALAGIMLAAGAWLSCCTHPPPDP
jgi:hypothetical protein